MVNTRSIKNKVELVIENSELENVDILAITETWLSNTAQDQPGSKQCTTTDNPQLPQS